MFRISVFIEFFYIIFSVDDVASALVQILEDDSSSGKCLMVTKQVGTKYAEYQQYPDS